MNTPDLSLAAPAKINLFLQLTGRREDGYHELQTLFQLLTLHDRVDFTLNTTGQVTWSSDVQFAMPQETNLIQRAAELLQQRYPEVRRGVHLHLHKRLPLGGGLGGGSSDAATTLLGLNALWELGLSEATLLTLGLELGADVPLFVKGRSAWAEGLGEALRPVALPETLYLLFYPGVSCSTSAMFAQPDLERFSSPCDFSAAMQRLGHNAFEPIARRLFAPVETVFNWCQRQGLAVALTGSGAVLYAPIADQEQGLACLKAFARTPIVPHQAAWLTSTSHVSLAHQELLTP